MAKKTAKKLVVSMDTLTEGGMSRLKKMKTMLKTWVNVFILHYFLCFYYYICCNEEVTFNENEAFLFDRPPAYGFSLTFITVAGHSHRLLIFIGKYM